jgi:putative ABC transport system ATP-binding protein
MPVSVTAPAVILDIEDLAVIRGEGDQAHRVLLPRLRITEGGVLAISGASGCGKSTLLEAIGLLLGIAHCSRYRLMPAQAVATRRGVVDVRTLLQKKDRNALANVRARYLGFVLQSGGLLPFLTVDANIHLPRRLLGMTPTSAHIAHAIVCLGLATVLHKYPRELSIGERQRVAFVRALAHEPALVLADEPTAALDPHRAQDLLSLFLQLVGDFRMGALIVSHDWALMAQFGVERLHATTARGEAVFEPAC